MPQTAVLAIDEGTTNAKAVLVDPDGRIIASGSAPVPIRHPQSGWVEQDANAIWHATTTAIAACVAGAPGVTIAAIGISNQRESILVWDRQTGRPLGPVITWQCRRTDVACAALRDAGHEPDVIARTGLPLDPLFPPTKARWLLDRVAGDADPCIGTVDSWLIWNLTGGAVHATDRSNAARTQLFNLSAGAWDDALCTLFAIPAVMLPRVQDSSGLFGTTRGLAMLPDGLPVTAAIGDSHAALFAHGAFDAGDAKVTFGTGSSVMATLDRHIAPPKGLTTTIAWSVDGRSTFAFEGNILTSASIFPWTADLLGLDSVDDLLALAQTVDNAGGVTIVPAHVGLGAPHWDATARGLITGLSFGSGPAHVARAAADSLALQVQDVFAIMAAAMGKIGRVSVDGGASRNLFLMQIVADVLDRPVTPCRAPEASALGAAGLAGLAVGVWSGLDQVAGLAERSASLTPALHADRRAAMINQWNTAIARTIHSAK